MSHTTIDIHRANGLAALWHVHTDGERLIANAVGKRPTRCTAFRASGDVREKVASFADGIAWLRREAITAGLPAPRERDCGGEE